MPDTPTRKRGGQPGNHNARKHGAFAEQPTPIPPHISNVLDRQVTFLDQLLQTFQQDLLAETSIEQRVALMRAASLSAISIVRVLRARQFNVQEENESFNAALNRALTELNQEIGLEPLPPQTLS